MTGEGMGAVLQCAACTVNASLSILHNKCQIYTVNSTQPALHCTQSMLHSQCYTVNMAQFLFHSQHCTAHSQCYKVKATQSMLHSQCSFSFSFLFVLQKNLPLLRQHVACCAVVNFPLNPLFRFHSSLIPPMKPLCSSQLSAL